MDAFFNFTISNRSFFNLIHTTKTCCKHVLKNNKSATTQADKGKYFGRITFKRNIFIKFSFPNTDHSFNQQNNFPKLML
jgi:hypothetical protein